MNSGETIRAQVELPCSIRLNGSPFRIARGVTEELTRESVIVILSSISGKRWLKTTANVVIMIELPSASPFEPRVLECAANISRVLAYRDGVRIVVAVHGMSVTSRDADIQSETPKKHRQVTHPCAVEHNHSPAVARSQNNNSVIHANHSTDLNSNLAGENTMSFLKNFLREEEGQGMIEYGLVISLVVLGGIVAYSAFSNTINNAINTVGGSITTNVK